MTIAVPPEELDEMTMSIALAQCADQSFTHCDQITQHLAHFSLPLSEEDAAFWIDLIDPICLEESERRACDTVHAMILHAPGSVSIGRRRNAAVWFQDSCEAGESEVHCNLHGKAIMLADRLGFPEISQREQIFGSAQAFAIACISGSESTCDRLRALRTWSLDRFPDQCANGDKEACEIVEFVSVPTWVSDLANSPAIFEFSKG